MARREVASGQRYKPIDANSIWEVRELANDGEGIGHARLVKVGDETAVKTISISALRDNRLYRLLPPEPSAA